MSKRHKILCVDDEEGVLDALERVFLDEDWEILRARDAAEAAEILERTEVSVVISDYRMPGINGVDLLTEISRRWPKPIRIVLSGYAEAHAIVAAINEGHVYKFVPKPWDDSELLVTIRRAVERFELDRENERLQDELFRKNAELAKLNATLEQKIKERTKELQAHADGLKFAQEVLEQLPYALVGIDASGMVIFTNQRTRELLSAARPIELGVPMESVLPGELESVARFALRSRECISRRVALGERRLWMDCQPLGGKAGRGLLVALRSEEAGA